MMEIIRSDLDLGILTFTYKGEKFQFEAKSEELICIIDFLEENFDYKEKETKLTSMRDEVKESEQVKNAIQQFKAMIGKKGLH